MPSPRIRPRLHRRSRALNVPYKYEHSEGHARRLKNENELRALAASRGDSIDSTCVAVCPTGIDVRNGAQLDCVQCGLCIDALRHHHGEIGRETRLIGYDNDIDVHRRSAGKPRSTASCGTRTVTYSP